MSEWIDMIDISFLPQEMKKAYKDLLENRMKAIAMV